MSEFKIEAFERVIEKIDWSKSDDGLVPCIVQQVGSGTVLMLAWMNREALAMTLDLGKVTFFSRSRQELWTKGETSGNYLEFVSLSVDCDGDTLLVLAKPTGPVCHTGQTTCFGNQAGNEYGFLADLQRVIDQRIESEPSSTAGSSYTAELLHGPFHRVAQKVGEEAVETILAATSRDADAMLDEAADRVYHLMVMLVAKGERFAGVVQRLNERHASRC